MGMSLLSILKTISRVSGVDDAKHLSFVCERWSRESNWNHGCDQESRYVVS